MKVETFETPQDAAKALAGEVAELIRTRAAEGKNVVLGLATGATPLPFYAELVRMHKEEGLSFANVISFNLDEYSGLDRDHPESYWYFMHTNLFNHIDIKPEAGPVELKTGINRRHLRRPSWHSAATDTSPAESGKRKPA